MKKVVGFLKIIFFVVAVLVLFALAVVFMAHYNYEKYAETGVMDNGNLCISHVWEGGGGYAQKIYISNENVIAETDSFALSEGKNGVFGKVYEPISAGNADLYFGYADFGGEPLNQFELYHIEVDENLNIGYSMENISKADFEKVCK